VVAARLDGFRAALREAGLPEEADLIVRHGEFDYEAGMAAAQKLLTRPDRPTAIICSSDDLAAGVVGQANRLGLQLPRDLSVTGFDDTILASRVWPPLTVVRQPVEEMAFRAAQCLIAALGKSASGVSDEVFEHDIVQRASVARPVRT
jgi:LacI family transcriptional regulator